MITHIYVYQAKDGDWRWHMKRKGRIVAESGEGYERRAGCIRTLHRLLESITNTEYKIEGEKDVKRRADKAA